MSSIDNELLISEVQKYEVLWNTADEGYKDKVKKNGAWIKVASSLINSFIDENEAQQKIICKCFFIIYNVMIMYILSKQIFSINFLERCTIKLKIKCFYFCFL